jgi:hypothetical protein
MLFQLLISDTRGEFKPPAQVRLCNIMPFNLHVRRKPGSRAQHWIPPEFTLGLRKAQTRVRESEEFAECLYRTKKYLLNTLGFETRMRRVDGYFALLVASAGR